MDELHLVGIALAIYSVGVVLALLFKGRLLKIIGVLSAIIAIPFFLLMMIAMGSGTGSSSHDGGGLALLVVLVGPIGLPTLGFISGWAAKFALKEEANLQFPLNYIGMGIMIFGPFFLLFNVTVLQPELKSSEVENFVNSTGVPVKLGDDVLTLPIRSGINKFSDNPRFDDIEKLKARMENGPIDRQNLKFRGLSDFHTPSRTGRSQYKPRDCELSENEGSIRCNFIKPEFTLMFGELPGSMHIKRYKTVDPIRVVDGFDVVREKWSEPKTENEKPKLSSFSLRDSSMDNLNGLEIQNITSCNRIRDEYSCTAYIYPINGKPQISYKFVTEEADIPVTIQKTRSIAYEYWNTLLATYGEKTMESQ